MTTTGLESSLSPWAGPYVTDMLGKGAALGKKPYEAYKGPLTAGASNLQNQAFSGLGSLGIPQATSVGSFTGSAYTPPTAAQAAAGSTGGYSPASGNMVQNYMTPYLETALQPQYDAAIRDNLMSQQALQGKYGKAGAYGGSRQGVAEAELQRGLLDRMAGITGTGYQNAYLDAQNQFNKDRTYGLEGLMQQANFGAVERGIDAEGINADIAAFEAERDDPYKQLQFQQSLLQGLPISTQAYNYTEPSTFNQAAGGAGTILDLMKTIGFFGGDD
jgi:hypothetical protein